MLITALLLVIILGVLIFIHELGHFLAAKRAGVRVEEFAFGFQPRLWAKKVGETEYALNLIPLGGYVRMYGENDDQVGPRSYRGKSALQKLGILIAGVVMNFLFGWLCLIILFIVGFTPLFPGVANNPFVTTTQRVNIVSVSAGSPAQAAGLQPGDQLLSVNGAKVATADEFLADISNLSDQTARLTINRAGATQTIAVFARANPPADQGPTGISIESSGKVKTTVLRSPAAALYESGSILYQSAAGFIGFVAKLVIHQRVSENVTGIVGVGELTGVARRLGWDYVVQLVALVSLGLSAINLMPILPLDGGQIVVVLYEKIRGRTIGERALGAYATAGIAFVILVFIIVTYKDIVRFDVIRQLF